MKISIVIPVYNEGEHLKACLDSLARQTSEPYEVIVVDNNSTDTTRVVADYYDFVTVSSEARQGVVHARTNGFDKARGDIIARIDGDTILPPDWVETIEQVFADPELDATSGAALYYGVALASVFDSIDLFFRRRLSKKIANHLFLWGSNMAIRKSAWTKVKPYLCQKGGQHEDYDIAIHLQELGGKVTFDERLKVEVSSRRIDTDFIGFMKYAWVSPSTYTQHGHGLKLTRHFYPVLTVCAIGYLPAYLLHRGYNPSLKRFSFSYLLFSATNVARVDPTANVV